ncbi:MAG TPA: DUF4147 domain-containing protein, partial [Acidobacteriaceae bacterium]|nr:DUF4147 domain-containing protein [Acidobacteriaceae bacterium]
MPSSRSELIRSIFRRTLDQVDVAAAVQRQLRLRGSALEIASETVSLADLNTILIVAVGKAAAPMCEGAVRALRDAPVALEAIVVAPQPPRDPIPALTFFPGAHPTPDADSCAAAQAVLHRLGIVDGRTLVLFLISGGASAMLEVSIDPEITIADTAN